MNSRQLIADFSLIVALGIVLYFFAIWIFQPMTEDYSFQTVKTISNLYDEPIYLIFNWNTEDELQVGKLITLSIELQNLPYSNTSELEDIKIIFDENDLNFF